ncbi:MAG: hypothetical protein E7617_02505 [Ruminococcaceae bacterium]|nr:hypothetical protein [Oscillospiraceae bacterium]
MIRELKDSYSYTVAMLLLSVLTFIFGIAFAVFGELLLPFATASAAALFVFENPGRRILSFAIPAITLVIAFVMNGFYAIICVEYIILALLLALLYSKGISKAECVTYMTLVTAVFMVLALYLGAGKATGNFTFEAVSDFYSDIYARLRAPIVEFISSRKISLPDGTLENYMSIEEAGYLFDSFAKLLPAMLGVASLVITAIALKLFTAFLFRLSRYGILKSFAFFMPSPITAYAYVAVAILSSFVGINAGWFAVAIANASEIMMIVFAFIGFNYLNALARMSSGRSTMYFIVAAAIIMFGGAALQLLGFIGAWFAIKTDKIPNKQ